MTKPNEGNFTLSSVPLGDFVSPWDDHDFDFGGFADVLRALADEVDEGALSGSIVNPAGREIARWAIG
jgi:hypothetical protein